MSAINRIKDLNEKRGAKLKEASAIVDKARAENRELTAEENKKVTGLHDEVDGIESTLKTEIRQASYESAQAPQLSKDERKTVDRFDLNRLLNHMDCVRMGQHSELDGVERELVQEGTKEARSAGLNITGIMLPRVLVRRGNIDFERRDMSVTGGTTTQYGGALVATEKVGLLEDFYKGSVLRQNGAMVLEGLVGNVDLPRYVKATDPTKETENANADELSPTITDLNLAPNRLPAAIKISDMLLAQSSANLETFLRRELSRQLLAIQEVAFFHGGGTNEPVGIAGTSGIGSVAGGTNGAAPDWADIVDLETAVAIDDANVGNLHYITNAKVRGKLKKTLVTATYGDRMVWAGNDLNGYVPLVTNAVSSALTKGSSNGVCSAIFFGNVSDFVMAYWGGLSLQMVTDYTLSRAGQRALVANIYYDGGVLRAESFAAMLDALTT